MIALVIYLLPARKHGKDIEPFLSSTIWEDRFHAVDAIGMLANIDSVPALLKIFDDPHQKVRENAALPVRPKNNSRKRQKLLKLLDDDKGQSETFFSPFRPPADSVMTLFKLDELQKRLNQLRNLISVENRTEKPASVRHLAKFVMLNPHTSDYARHLDELLHGRDR